MSTAMTYLRHSPTSSHGERVIGALVKYLLLDSEGSNDNRCVWVSETALRILADRRDPSPERDALVRKCALAPNSHRLLWERYGADLPDNASVQAYLVLERGFMEKPAQLLLRNYKATVAYARLDESGTLGGITADDEGADLPTPLPEGPVAASVSALLSGVPARQAPRVRAGMYVLPCHREFGGDRLSEDGRMERFQSEVAPVARVGVDPDRCPLGAHSREPETGTAASRGQAYF